MATTELTLRVANAIGEVAAEAWDACADPARPAQEGDKLGGPDVATENRQFTTSEEQSNPFLSHDFLSSLELSNSVRARSGWQPMHLLAEVPNGALLGAVPCYVKSHSQ